MCCQVRLFRPLFSALLDYLTVQSGPREVNGAHNTASQAGRSFEVKL
jgi:hypothetical protein